MPYERQLCSRLLITLSAVMSVALACAPTDARAQYYYGNGMQDNDGALTYPQNYPPSYCPYSYNWVQGLGCVPYRQAPPITRQEPIPGGFVPGLGEWAGQERSRQEQEQRYRQGQARQSTPVRPLDEGQADALRRRLR